jgi:hypothetical protein
VNILDELAVRLRYRRRFPSGRLMITIRSPSGAAAPIASALAKFLNLLAGTAVEDIEKGLVCPQRK